MNKPQEKVVNCAIRFVRAMTDPSVGEDERRTEAIVLCLATHDMLRARDKKRTQAIGKSRGRMPATRARKPVRRQQVKGTV